MNATWMSAAACVSAIACVSPVDYGEPVVDASGDPPCVVYGDNEDNDCVGDKRDLCPTVPTPGQGDFDRDEVGDACDRQPEADNDIVFFAGFGPNDEPRSWDGSYWYIKDGDLTMSVLDGAGSASPYDVLSAPLLVVADVRVTAGKAAEVSLFVEYSADLGDGSECYVLGSPDGKTGVLGWSRVHDGMRELSATTAMLRPVFEEGQSFQLSVEHTFNGAVTETRCSYATSGGFTATVSHPTGHDGRGRLRLAARDARVLVGSLIAYQQVY